jgi:uncharacterized protein with GYD domain
MNTFVMLTRVAPTSVHTPQTFEALARQAADHIRRECPDVTWLANYAVLGRYDYVDIFTAPDVATATRVSTIIRSYGGADAEVLPATEWREFKDMLHGVTHAPESVPLVGRHPKGVIEVS